MRLVTSPPPRLDEGLGQVGVLRPDFREPLPFPVVVAEDLDIIILTQPPMYLGEKLAALPGARPGTSTFDVSASSSGYAIQRRTAAARVAAGRLGSLSSQRCISIVRRGEQVGLNHA